MRSVMMVPGLSAKYKNGTVVIPQNIIAVPVKRRGEWALRDMLNLRSVEALWVGYKQAEKRLS
jgi:hypothetical protein